MASTRTAKAELARLRAATPRSLWLDDLAALEHGMDALEREERDAALKVDEEIASRKRKAPAAKEKARKK